MDKRIGLTIVGSLVLYGFISSATTIGVGNGLLIALGLLWVFGLGFAANLALSRIMRGPVALWKALMPALLCFAPQFLGAMPLGNWMTTSAFPEGHLPLTVITLPSILAVLGLVLPGGFVIDGFNRIRNSLRNRP